MKEKSLFPTISTTVAEFPPIFKKCVRFKYICDPAYKKKQNKTIPIIGQTTRRRWRVVVLPDFRGIFRRFMEKVKDLY